MTPTRETLNAGCTCPKVVALVAALRDPPIRTTQSLLHQASADVDVVVVAGFESAFEGLDPVVMRKLVSPDMRLDTGARVSHALNLALTEVELSMYDYILKGDEDTTFPPSFLVENIAAGFDLMGRGGGLLIRTQPFVRAMGGKFEETSADDVYLLKCFEVSGYKVLVWDWECRAEVTRPPSYTWRRMYRVGKDYFRLGDPLIVFLPIVLDLCRHRTPLYAFLLVGYVVAAIEMQPKHVIAARVREWEFNRLKAAVRRCFRQE